MNGGMKISSQMSLQPAIKRFLAIFLSLAAILGGILATFYYTQARNERAIIETEEVQRVGRQTDILASDCRVVISDLMFLSEQNELLQMLEGDEDNIRQALAEEWLLFSTYKGLYDQIRFLDETGMEVVRVNFNNNDPSIMPDDQLQSKAGRYYFEDTLALNRREVHVSPFDLNVEHGEIEQPLKPMIRFGTPVFDSYGQTRGIVLLNYLGTNLLSDLETAPSSHSQFMLLNSDGFWLKGLKSEDEWGFMFEDRSHRVFSNDFPEAWQKISATESGQFYNDTGVLTFATIHPLLEGQETSTSASVSFEPGAELTEASDYYWKLVSYMPQEALNAGVGTIIDRGLLLYASLAVVLVVVSWSLASTGARHTLAEMELRKHRDHLEVLVAARTAELTTLNKQFQVVGVLRRQDIAKRKRVELELTSSRQQLRNLAVHTQSAREEERKSVARQVHDELGQLLTVLKMDLSWLGKRLPEERILLLEKTKTMSKLVDKTIQTVRRVSTELRPGLLDNLGLTAAIEWHAEEFQNWTGITCKVTSGCANAILGQDLSTTIFRVFQEALLNVARHANATEVKVSLRKEDGRLVLEISDNGIGITKEEIADPKSFGLIGIRERILSWEGKVDIRGTPNNGTTVTASIPLDRGGVVQY